MPTNPAQGASRSTQLLPLFPLGTVLVPGMPLSLHIFEPRYRQLVADLLAGGLDRGPVFGVVALRRGTEVGEIGDVYDVGTTAVLTDVVSHPDGRFDLLAIGEQRFAIESLDTATQPYLTAAVRYLAEADGELPATAAADARRLWHTHLQALTALTGIDPDRVEYGQSARELSYSVAQLPTLTVTDRQALLACRDTAGRLNTAARILRRETLLLRRLHAVPASTAVLAAGQPSAS